MFFNSILIIKITFWPLFLDSFVFISGSELRNEECDLLGPFKHKTDVILEKSLKFCFSISLKKKKEES